MPYLKIIFITLTTFYFTSNIHSQQAPLSLKITHLIGDFYVYETYNLYKGNRIGANGLYFLTNDGAVIIDSPWDTTQFQPLLDSIKIKHNKTSIYCIATHFHEDRTAGLEYFKRQKLKTYTTKQTDSLSILRGMKRAEYLIFNDTSFKVGQYNFQVFYPGKGHAPDNIVIWFPAEKILYGGCLIKSVDDKSLGNLGDASIQDYPATLLKVKKKFNAPKYIIPGHNDWKDARSLSHTLEMAEKLK